MYLEIYEPRIFKGISATTLGTELRFGKLYRRRKSKDKFVNQSHPTKIVNIRAFFVFLKKSF